jgi:hypothetical protein
MRAFRTVLVAALALAAAAAHAQPDCGTSTAYSTLASGGSGR